MRRLRVALGLAALALLVGAFAPAFRPRELRARLEGPRDPEFFFDPQYPLFLDGVERATPPDATVALFAPPSPLYLTQAAYRLAPRRVVGRELAADARIVAVYRRGREGAPPPGAQALPGGFLLRR
jgi:hypothetical protein